MNSILILLFALLFVTSCKMKSNVAIYEKDNIRFLGVVNKQGESTYRTLTLGTFSQPVNLENYKIGIELSEDQKVLISDISVELLISSEFEESDYSHIEGYPQDTISLCKNGYRFIIYRQKIYEVIISNCLWNESFTKKFEMPIGRNEAVELFGEPDLEYQTFYW